MKRISKSLLVSILLVVTSSGFVGGTAAAKTDTSTETNWSYNSDTKTVTLHGDGSFPYYSNTLFGDITKEIEHVKMDETLLGSETDFFWKNTEDYLPALKTAEGSLGNGFYWFADYTQDTLLISGTGELTFPDGPAYLFPNMDTCILDDDITSIQTNSRYIRFTNLQLGADTNINAQFSAGDSLNLSVSDSYIVSSDNPYYAVYDGVLYSKDYSRLISCPSNKTSISFHPDVTTIQSHSFYYSHLVYGENKYQTGFADSKNTLVIPWGVTTVEKDAFQFDAFQSVTFILPDTLTELAIDPYSFYLYSKNNQAADSQSFSSEYRYKKVDSVAAYYGITPNSFKTFGSKTYYFDADCKMVTSTQTINGKTYTFDQNGVLQEESDSTPASAGVVYQDGKAYIYDEDGNMLRSGWYQAEGNWYYLNDYGAGVVKCWRLKDGKYVYLGADGKMQTNCWIKDYNEWYYVKADGTRYESAWAKIDGSWYWFGGSGKMMSNGWLKLADGKWYYFRSDGQMATGWIQDGGKSYYLTESGAMATNKWIKSGSYWYYLGSNGALLTNTTTPDGYHVDSEGRWI